jgi:hypothetical protein
MAFKAEGFNIDGFKLGWLREKHAAATGNVGKCLSNCLNAGKLTEQTGVELGGGRILKDVY